MGTILPGLWSHNPENNLLLVSFPSLPCLPPQRGSPAPGGPGKAPSWLWGPTQALCLAVASERVRVQPATCRGRSSPSRRVLYQRVLCWGLEKQSNATQSPLLLSRESLCELRLEGALSVVEPGGPPSPPLQMGKPRPRGGLPAVRRGAAPGGPGFGKEGWTPWRPGSSHVGPAVAGEASGTRGPAFRTIREPPATSGQHIP